MLASKMFATTLLSQQIHDTVCSVGKERVRYRIGGEWLYVVAVAMKEEYKSYKSHFLLLYSSPLPILRYTPTHSSGSSFFSLSQKAVRTTALFCEHWIWNRQMGPKTLKSQFTMRTVDVLVCDSLLGGEW